LPWYVAVPVTGAVVAAVIGYRRFGPEADGDELPRIPGAIVPQPVTDAGPSPGDGKEPASPAGGVRQRPPADVGPDR
jgi:hypothetical protein